MATERACYACTQPLLVLSRGEARCSPSCPGGGRFARCGFCHQISFALGKPETPYCYNPECRMHGRARRRCDQCRQVSLIEVAGHHVCLNRRCDRNKDQLESCAICGREGRAEPSFMSVAGMSFCGRGACDALLIAVSPCTWCGSRTLASEEKTCIWPDCEAYGLEQTVCGRCDGPALVDTDGGEPICKRDDCTPAGIDVESLSPDMTIMDLWAAAPMAKERAESQAPLQTVDDVVIDDDDLAPPEEELDELPITEAPAEDPPVDVTIAEPTPPPPDTQPPAATPPTSGIPVGGLTILEHTTPPLSKSPIGSAPELAAAAAAPEATENDLVASPASPPSPTPAPAATPPPTVPDAGREMAGIAGAPTQSGPPPTDSPLGLALGALEDDLIGDAPLAVILGAIGSGKTTFLTTLGHMLAARDAAYHFPYTGVTVRRFSVQDLLERRLRRGQAGLALDVQGAVEATVRDLAHDFAQPLYDCSLAVGAWPPPTRAEDSRILVADLVRGLQPAARLVTVEVPGEALEECLRDQAANRPSSDALAATAGWLLERGERLVLLLDPTAERTDAMYEGLFRVLRDALAPRALNAVARKVRERLEARGQRGIIDEFERAASQHDRDAAEREAAERIRKEWEGHVKALGEGVAGDDPRGALATNEDTLRRLEQAWREVFPQEYQQATAYVREREFSLEAIVTYCRGLVKNTMTGQRWNRLAPALVRMELAAGGQTVVSGGNEREIAQVTIEVLEDEGLPREVKIDLAGDLRTDRVPTRYQRLRSLALCVTKSDAIPLVHPPAEDPPRRFPRTAGPLREVEAYLKLDGGDVRYYHTSATGYSLDSGIGRVPGPAGSCTPVNVLEPVLDGLIH